MPHKLIIFASGSGIVLTTTTKKKSNMKKTIEEIMNEVLNITPEEWAERHKPNLSPLDLFELQEETKPLIMSAHSVIQVAIKNLMAKNLYDIADKLIYADMAITECAKNIPKFNPKKAKVLEMPKK